MAKHLTLKQRMMIFCEKMRHESLSAIAKIIGVHKSTISRELKRHCVDNQLYDPLTANTNADIIRSNASKQKRYKKITTKMREYITEKLLLKWSPEQIAGRMLIDFKIHISHQTIYNFIYDNKNNGGKLYRSLSHKGKRYRYKRFKISKIKGRVDISCRPSIVETKERIGDLEIDTIVSAKNTGKSCLVTLVDRKTKFTIMRRMKDKSSMSMQITIEQIAQECIIPIKTITSDNGLEFANHQNISNKIGCQFYFATPYRSCERGLNEHTNGKIRKYFPKGTNLI